MHIGGYNELSLKDYGTELHSSAIKYQSARAALYDFLKNQKPRSIYLPLYICDSLLPAIKSLKITIKWYSINKNLLPLCPPDVRKGEFFLIINYFGLLSESILDFVRDRPERFIIDNSQALFAKYIENTTSIYSPRKFLAMPDGGLLRTSNQIEVPTDTYNATDYISHLMLRAAGETHLGYKKFLDAEQALENFKPKAMSKISRYLLRCSDVENIKAKRRLNYQFFYNKFISLNNIDLPLGDNVPLCYPLQLSIEIKDMCIKLIKLKVFLPRYWASQKVCEQGEYMYKRTLFLPIDERITEIELLDLYKIIMEETGNEY